MPKPAQKCKNILYKKYTLKLLIVFKLPIFAVSTKRAI